MSAEMTVPFAAVLYDEGAAGDLFLASVARTLRAQGYRLAGVVQTNEQYDSLCACDMTLSDLSSGAEIRISQRLGRLARGCRLDSAKLAEAVGLAEAGFDAGADLVILNKFGKSESEGGGFRPLISTVIGSGIPLVIAVPWRNIESWRAFAGGMGQEIAFEGEAETVAGLLAILGYGPATATGSGVEPRGSGL